MTNTMNALFRANHLKILPFFLLAFVLAFFSKVSYAQTPIQSGLGVFARCGSELDEWVSTVNPKSVVLLDDFSCASSLPSSITIIGRSSGIPSDPDAAQSSMKTLMESYPAVDVWQGFNEPLFEGWSLQQLRDYEIKIINAASQVVDADPSRRITVCLGNFKEGYPTNAVLNSPEYRGYTNQITVARKSAGVSLALCVHEHDNGTSPTDSDWAIGSSEYNGRFTKLQVGGFASIPVHVTVAGYDSNPFASGSGGGWKSAVDAETYRQMLNAYYSGATSAGAVSVNVFSLGLDSTWEEFDVYELLEAGSGGTPPPGGGTGGGSGAQCVGPALADYTAFVLDGLKGFPLNEVRLLSPAFNFTNPAFPALVTSYHQGLIDKGYTQGIRTPELRGIAGNAYNMATGQTILDWVDNARSTEIQGTPIYLTEAGWYPNPGDASSYDVLKFNIENLSAKGVAAVNLFNVFNNNKEFEHHAFVTPTSPANDVNATELKDTLCSGDCGGLLNVGANSGRYYVTPEAEFYSKAREAGMEFIVEIANNDLTTAINGINVAHNNGLTPILRLGVGDSGGGFEPTVDADGNVTGTDLVDFIKGVESAVTNGRPVYIIVGSNEPLSECWATPGCTCSSDKGPAGQGVDSISCYQTLNDENKVPRTVTGRIWANKVFKVTLPGTRKVVNRDNLPIWGAVVTSYHGDKCTASGKSNGQITYPINSTATDSEGRYTLQTYYSNASYEHDSDTIAKVNFLVFSCGGEPKDIYMCDMTRGNIEGLDVALDCDGEVSTNGTHITVDPTAPPADVDYAIRDNFLSCRINPSNPKYWVSKEQIIRELALRVNDREDEYIGADPDPDCAVNGPRPGYDKCMPPFEHTEASEPLEGRGGAKTRFSAHYPLLSQLIGPFTGTFVPRYDTDDSYPLPKCSTFKEYYRNIISDERSELGFNTLLGSGPAIALKNPSSWMKSDIVKAGETEPMCIDDSDASASFHCGKDREVLYGEFVKPWTGEPSLVTGCAYPAEYFPWHALLTPDETKRGSAGKVKNETMNDSFVPEGPRYIPFVEDRGNFVAQSHDVNEMYPDNGIRSEILESCLTSGAGCPWANKDGFTVATGYFNIPGTPLGIEPVYKEDGSIETYVTDEKTLDLQGLPTTCYRIGTDLVGYCSCAQAKHAEGYCPPEEEFLYNLFSDQDLSPGFFNGYKFISRNTIGGDLTFFNARAYGINGILGAIVNAIYGVWDDIANPGGTCLEYDYGPAQTDVDGTMCQGGQYTDPVDNETYSCRGSCNYITAGRELETCNYPSDCGKSDTACSVEIANVEVGYGVANPNPACLGDLAVTASHLQHTRREMGLEMGPGIRDMARAMLDPVPFRLEDGVVYPRLNGVKACKESDFDYTNEENPNKPGYGYCADMFGTDGLKFIMDQFSRVAAFPSISGAFPVVPAPAVTPPVPGGSGNTSGYCTVQRQEPGYCSQDGPYPASYTPANLATFTNRFPNSGGVIGSIDIIGAAIDPLNDFIDEMYTTYNKRVVAAYGYRSYNFQLSLCEDCESKGPGAPCRVAAAACSNHRSGIAVDLFIVNPDGSIEEMDDPRYVAIGQKYGFNHPLGAADPPHYEYGTAPGGITPTTGKCDGKAFAKILSTVNSGSELVPNPVSSMMPSNLSQNESVYAQLESSTGIPCEVFAGIHFAEGANDPNRSMLDGSPLSGGQTLFDTGVTAADKLKQFGIYAGYGSNPSSWTWAQLVTLISNYNGGSNRNCAGSSNICTLSTSYSGYAANCPPSSPGADDPYAVNKLNPEHSDMALINCGTVCTPVGSNNCTCTICDPLRTRSREGVLTVSYNWYKSK